MTRVTLPYATLGVSLDKYLFDSCEQEAQRRGITYEEVLVQWLHVGCAASKFKNKRKGKTLMELADNQLG